MFTCFQPHALSAAELKTLYLKLCSACMYEKWATVKSLVDAGAPVNDANYAEKKGDFTPLMWAASNGAPADEIQLFVERGSDVTPRYSSDGKHGGRTALMLAAWNGAGS